jgi:hypothetical protein
MEDKRRITKEEGEELAGRLNCKFIEISALNNYNVQELFTILVRDIINIRKTNIIRTEETIKEEPKKENNCNI